MTSHLDNYLFGKAIERLFEKECRRRRIPCFAPVDDTTACDRLVRLGDGVLVVQIKGVRTQSHYKRGNAKGTARRYIAENHRRNGARYHAATVDVVAFYVQPLDRWHIFPASLCKGKRIKISVNPTGPMKDAIGNWALLGADPNRRVRPVRRKPRAEQETSTGTILTPETGQSGCEPPRAV